MKSTTYLMLAMAAAIFTSCSDNDQPSFTFEGSPRDWTYTKPQLQFLIDDVKQTNVSEITIRSIQLDASPGEFPWYRQTLSVKGLLKNNKVFNIQVEADVDRFEGSTIYNDIEYSVTGNYTGSPFEHQKDMGIIVYMSEKK